MLDVEDGPDHGRNAKVHGEHDEVTHHQQARAKHLVLNLVLNITLTLVTLLDAAAKHQGNCNSKDALEQDCVGDCIEAVLRPSLWSTIDWVHLQRTHAGTNEQNGRHGSEEHRHDSTLKCVHQL